MTFLIVRSALVYLTTLLFGEALFLIRLPRRSRFVPKVVICVAVYYAFGFGLGCLAELYDTYLSDGDIGNNVFQVFYFLVLFSFSVPLIVICWRIKFRDAVFYAVAGYSLEHISQMFIGIILYFVGITGAEIHYVARLLLFNVLSKLIIIFGVFIIYVYPALKSNRINISDNRILAVSVINLIICLILSVFKGYGFGNPVNGFTSSVICGSYAVFGCFLCLGLQMGIFREKNLQEDNVTLEKLLHEEAQKHELSKNTVDLINIKCHDLKYRLRKLENDPKSVDKEILDDLYKTVSIYDSITKTGNEVLDVVIMNFWSVFSKYNMQFTYMVDGSALSVMRPVDISSLFGNLLDNATECVLREKEDERIISMSVHKEKQMLIIHIHNTCTTPPVFEDGLPVTTKDDKEYHGFGVRSVRYLVKKYNGNVQMSWKDNVFSVDIII